MTKERFSKTYLKEVAEIIMDQLCVNQLEMMAWGFNNPMFRERDIYPNTYPALMFKVRTPLLKKGGRVIISYNYILDEYIVEAIRLYNGVETRIGIREGVFFDQLHDVINSLIETEETMKEVFF